MSPGCNFLPIWGPFEPYFGAFWGTFLEACLNLYVNRDMHENISIYNGLAMSEPLEKWLFRALLGSFLDAF